MTDILARSLILYEESEKIGPETICQPPIFQLGRFLLTLSLKLISSEILSVITYKSNFFLNSPTELYERILVYYVTDPVYLEKFETFLKYLKVIDPNNDAFGVKEEDLIESHK